MSMPVERHDLASLAALDPSDDDDDDMFGDNDDAMIARADRACDAIAVAPADRAGDVSSASADRVDDAVAASAGPDGAASVAPADGVGNAVAALVNHAGAAVLHNIHNLHQLALARQPGRFSKWTRRTPELLDHARDRKAVNIVKRKLLKSQSEIVQLRGTLADVRQCFPKVAKACGIVAKRTRGCKGQISEQMAEKYVKLCFEFRQCTGFGIKPARLHAFGASLALALQEHGVRRLLWLCVRFKAQSPLHVVAISTSTEFDATKQMMAYEQIQRIGRASKRRVGTDVMVQRGRVHVVLQSEAETHTFSETIVMPPLVVMGKSAEYAVKCLEMNKPFNLDEAEIVQAISASTNSFVEVLRCDKGSSNIPALRHFATTLEDKCKIGLFDSGCCEVHVTNRIKNGAAAVTKTVGKLFCMANLFKLSSMLEGMMDAVEGIVDKELTRVVAAAPTDGALKWHAVFDELFNTSAKHHERQTSSRCPDGSSFLVSDIHELLQMLNDEPSANVWTHYCWDHAKKAACCQSLEDSKEKMTVRLCNLMITPAFPVVTMSRFTYVLKAMTRIICGLAVRRILPRCFGTGHEKGPSSIKDMLADVAEFGSGDSDLTKQHHGRIHSVGKWLNDRRTVWELPITFITTGIVSDFEYSIIPDKDAGTPLKTADMLDRFNSPLQKCLTKLADLLQMHFRRDGGWRLLGLLGFAKSTSDMRSLARSQILSLSAGVCYHFDDKYSELPWLFFRVVSEQWSVEEAGAVLDSVEHGGACCLPVFARHFKRLYDTRAKMESRAARGTLESWIASQAFQTLDSERGHASERASLHAASAPGRTFHHHARQDVLGQLRQLHRANGGLDPAGAPVSRNKQHQGGPKAVHDPFGDSLPLQVLGVPVGTFAEWRDVNSGVLPQLEDVRHHAHALQDGPSGVTAAGVAADVGQIGGGAPLGKTVVHSGQGGSIKMTFANSHFQARKLALGRTMTNNEMDNERIVINRRWEAMSDEDRAPYETRYQAQVSRRKNGAVPSQSPEAANMPVQRYVPHLGAGSPEHPITPKAFCAYHAKCGGFPKDAEVYKPSKSFVVRPGDVRQELRGTGTRANILLHTSWLRMAPLDQFKDKPAMFSNSFR